MKTGDLFAVPLPGRPGVYGAARLLAESGGHWLVAGVAHFGSPEVPADAPLLQHQPLAELPHRAGYFLYSGQVPAGWSPAGAGPLCAAARAFAADYQCWRDAARPARESAAAYERLAGVIDVRGLPRALAAEWRVRFDSVALRDELARQRAPRPEPTPTWARVSSRKPTRGLPEGLARVVKPAYAALLATIEAGEPAEPAIAAFHAAAQAHPQAAAFSAELSQLGADVARAWRQRAESA